MNEGIGWLGLLLTVDDSEEGPGVSDTRVAETLQIGVRSIESLRPPFVEDGLEACLVGKKQECPSIQRMFAGEKEAKLIPAAFSSPPKDPGEVDTKPVGLARSQGALDRQTIWTR